MNRWIVALAISLLTLIGCQETPPVGGKPRPKQYTTVVSLSPSTTEVIGTYFFNLKLVGRTSACNSPETVLKDVPVMATVKPDYEKIVAAKPSFVILDKSLYSDSDIQKLKDLKLEVVTMNVKTVQEFCNFLLETAGQVGGESDVSQSVDKILAAYNTEAPGPVRRKVLIILGDSTGEYMVAGLDTFQADLMRGAGCDPVGPKADKFQAVPVEQLIGFAPDVIVTTGVIDSVMKDPRLQSMGAIKARRVIRIDPDRLLRAGGQVDRVLNDLRPSVEGLF